MRALAYLLGARSLDVARDADDAIHRPKREVDLPPMATTPETAAAWRRWRDSAASAPEPTTVLQPNAEANPA
jgi:hypothetical protein